MTAGNELRKRTMNDWKCRPKVKYVLIIFVMCMQILWEMDLSKKKLFKLILRFFCKFFKIYKINSSQAVRDFLLIIRSSHKLKMSRVRIRKEHKITMKTSFFFKMFLGIPSMLFTTKRSCDFSFTDLEFSIF